MASPNPAHPIEHGHALAADGWIVEYYVVEDATLANGQPVKGLPVAGPYPTPEAVKAARDRITAAQLHRRGEVYCVKTGTDPNLYQPESERITGTAPITIFEEWPAGAIEAGDAGAAASMDEAAQIVRECGYTVLEVRQLFVPGGHIAAFQVYVEPPGGKSAEGAA